MANIYNQVLLFWLDVNGRPATTFWTSQDQASGAAGSYSALASSAQALSTAAVVAVQFQQTMLISSTAVSGDYQSVLDRAVLLATLEGLSGSRRPAIPAPVSSIFLPGNEVVDMANADVLAFLAQLQATIGDGNGHAISTFKRGWRARAGGGA